MCYKQAIIQAVTSNVYNLHVHLPGMNAKFAVRFTESKGVQHHGQNIEQTAPAQAYLTICSTCNIVETYRTCTSMLMTLLNFG